MTNNEEMSMLEVAEQLIQRKIKPQKFDKIAKEVCEIMGISDAEFEENVAQFYTDLTLSGKFVTVGEDKWDLKSRQKYEVANYDTYDIEFDDEEIVDSIVDDEFETFDKEVNGKVTEEEENETEDYDNDVKENEDDYSDESNAEVSPKEGDEFEGLAIYNESDFE